MERPRLLLVSEFTELQWTIKPTLEEWAEVASFDPPGVGGEPLPTGNVLTVELIARRGLDELEGRGWDECFVAGDGFGNAAALRIAHAWTGQVQGIALGHASLSNRRRDERPPISPEVWEALTELLRRDSDAFIKHGIVQATHGSVDEALAERMIERFPDQRIVASWQAITREDEPIEELLAEIDAPLLFAKHQGCLMSTEEGFDDAVAAFPQAKAVSVGEAPSVSEEFAWALREFCGEHAR
jgi:hypothetical protein